MAAKENNLSTIVSLIQVVKLLRGSSSTGESYLFSTKLYYWEDQSFECPKTQLDYLNMDRISSFIPPIERKRSSGRQGFYGHQAEKDAVHIYEVIEEVKSRWLRY